MNKLKILRDLEVKKLKKLLLFIHGLGGSKKSFGDFEKYIKEDSSLEEYEVDYYEYPTIKLYNPISWIIAAKIQSLADGLRTDIVTRYKRYDYIVLIGHSMGGLISKQYLLDEEENILNFSNPVKKVVMYGTPNIGSDYSKWFLSFNPQIRQLNRDSDFIEFLNRSLKKHKLIDYIDFYYVIGDKDRIVNRLSASNFWDTKFYSIPNKSHAMGNGVAKPKSKEDRTFTLLKNFLEKEQGLPNLTHDYLSKIIKHSTLDADNRYSLNNEKFKGTHIEIKEIDKAFSYIQNKKNFINELENLLSDIIYSQPSLEDYENIIPDLNKAKDAHASYFEEEEWEDLVGLEEKDMKIKEINDAFIFDILEKVENLKNSTYKSKQTILIDIREKIDLLIDQIYKKNSLHSALNPRGGFDETTSINDYAIISPITNKVEEIQELIYSIYAELYINQALLISGEALIGKTHMLCHISNRYIDEKKPIILILGHTVTTVTDLKKMILEKLDLSYLKFENFLKELNLLGEINNCNSLIVIDAINEAGDNKTWLNQLAGLLSEIKEYNNISIILSVRDVEEYRVINKTSENLITKIIHVGIEELTFEQFDNFCKIFDIHTPDIPIMNKINYNPGLLLLFLESLEKLDLKYIDTDILSPSYIFENIIKGSNRRISQKHSLDEDAELSQIAINLITEKFIEQEGNPILYKDAYRILQDKNLGIELIDLISEGLLGTFMKRDLKYVFFTYQKLGNYFISKFILNKYINFKDNHPTNETVTFLTRIITNNDHPWNNIMVLESISTLISETYNHELIEILDKYKNNGVIQITFMRSLLWRNKNSFNEITFKYLKELLKVNKDNRDNYFELLEVLLKLSTIPDHPLNAHRLQKHLKSQNMTIRDANWGEFLINSDKYRSIARIINWNWFYSSNYNIPEKVIILNGITLSWMLSSSDNEIRDQATKALVSIFTNKPVLFLSLLKMFEDIDDLYILERLYAVGYGIALRETNSLNLASLAIYVYDIQFKNNTPYPNILLRDFGRGIVELSCIEINTNLINPPYISTLSFDNIDINNLITYKNKKGFLQIWSSLMYDNNGGISDFGNYVVNRSLSNWSFHELNEQEAIPKNELDSFISNLDADKQSLWKKRINTKELMNIFTNEKDSENALQEYLNGIKEKKTKFEESLSLEESEIFNKNIKPDLDNNDKLIDRKKIFNYSLAQQWMFKRIIELGYSESTHGEIDKYLRSYNRRGKKIERIGKKYQWISYYELLARVSDNYKLSNRFDYNESKSYCGPWNPLIRNIDPSTILYKKEIAENYKLHFSYDFSSNENNLSEWLDNTSDVSSLQRIIENKFEHNNHLFLYGIFTFIDVTEKKDRKPQKQIYYKLQSYLVKNDEIENLFEWSKSQDFFGNWIPEQGDFYEVFLREYPHSRAFKDIDYKREGWTDCENELPNKIACSWDSYLNEVTNDSSIKESITLKLPSKILIETLGLIQDMKKDGVYHHKKLEDVIFDSSLQYTEESALLAKEEILDLLNTEGYALFWTLTGEKEIINRPSTLTELRLVISASGYYKDNEFIENYNFYRE